MALCELRSLDELAPQGEPGELDEGQLHVFVAGPGQGEAIAVALPHDGWLFVDGCRASGRTKGDSFVLPELKQRFGARRSVRALVLTHPHQDHAWGIGELIEELAPERVGVVGPGDPRATLAAEVDALDRARSAAAPTSAKLRTGAVLTALRAIYGFAERGGRLMGLHDGVELLSTPSGARVLARSPGLDWIERNDLPQLALGDANSLSTVLEVGFGATRVVLGADLPNQGHDRSGWGEVVDAHPELTEHRGLKLSHHGSSRSQHPRLVAPRGDEVAWWLTPFGSSTLPRPDDDDGLPALVSAQSPLMLTAAPISAAMQRAVDDGRVTPAELGELVRLARGRPRFDDRDRVLHVPRDLEALDAVWCTSFDDAGLVTARRRGRVALEVHRSPLGR